MMQKKMMMMIGLAVSVIAVVVAESASAFVNPPDWIIGTWRNLGNEWVFTSTSATLRTGSGTMTFKGSSARDYDSGFEYQITVNSPYGRHRFEQVSPGIMEYDPPIGGNLRLGIGTWRRVTSRSIRQEVDPIRVLQDIMVEKLVERIESLEKRVAELEAAID